VKPPRQNVGASRTINVLVVDDHPVVRSGLVAVLSSNSDICVVGEAQDGSEALQKAVLLNPDLVVIDVAMPGSGGIPFTARITREYPATHVLAISAHDEAAYVRGILRAGAWGYVLKSSDPSVLVCAIRAVHRGHMFIDPALSSVLAEELIGFQAAPNTRAKDDLSPREKEILGLLMQGKSYQQIAQQLGLSVKTVESYRSHISTKLGLHHRADLFQYACVAGILKVME